VQNMQQLMWRTDKHFTYIHKKLLKIRVELHAIWWHYSQYAQKW